MAVLQVRFRTTPAISGNLAFACSVGDLAGVLLEAWRLSPASFSGQAFALRLRPPAGGGRWRPSSGEGGPGASCSQLRYLVSSGDPGGDLLAGCGPEIPGIDADVAGGAGSRQLAVRVAMQRP